MHPVSISGAYTMPWYNARIWNDLSFTFWQQIRQAFKFIACLQPTPASADCASLITQTWPFQYLSSIIIFVGLMMRDVGSEFFCSGVRLSLKSNISTHFTHPKCCPAGSSTHTAHYVCGFFSLHKLMSMRLAFQMRTYVLRTVWG